MLASTLGTIDLSQERRGWWEKDSNLRRLSRQVYSLFPLAARAHPQGMLFKRTLQRLNMVANAADFSTGSRDKSVYASFKN